MKVIPFSDQAVTDALIVLQNGGVVAHATETCYGLACDLSNPDAVAKLFAIKQRPESQPVSALFASVDDAKDYVEWNDRAEELAKQYLPGPLTLILAMKENTPKVLHSMPPASNHQPLEAGGRRLSTIGIRVSSSPVAQAVVSSYGSPLSTTSANLHGQPNPYSAEDMIAQFAGQPVQPDLTIDSGTLPQNPPSTVVDLSGNNQIYRKGSITL